MTITPVLIVNPGSASPKSDRFIAPISNTRGQGQKFPQLRTLVSSVSILMMLVLFAAGLALPGRAAAATSAVVQTSTGPVELKSGEDKLLASINWSRSQAGLPQLSLDALTVSAARDRSADMANRHYFAHRTPDGKGFLDTLKQYGVKYKMAGEIIAQNNYPAAQSPAEAHRGFMNSPAHKQIIMMGNWTKVGIGEAVDGAGMFYYTVLFVQPRSN